MVYCRCTEPKDESNKWIKLDSRDVHFFTFKELGEPYINTWFSTTPPPKQQ